MLISNVIISPEVDLTILSSADFMHKLLQFNNGRIDENILNFFCYLLDDNLEGCHSLVEVGFVDHLLNMFDSLPISHQYQICKIFSFIITSEVRCQPLAEFLRYRMDVIDEQSHFTFELFITALKNGYDNDINGFLLFQLSTFDSEEKAYSAFKLISYLFETHEQETLAYFSWGAFSQFVKFEHEDETWISFCSMINSVFKYDTAQAELSLKYHIDDFLLGVFQNSSFSLKEIAIETLANLAKVNMENLLSKGYVTILIDFLCVPNDDLFILLVNSLFYLAFYAKGGKLTTEIATQFAECELALTMEGILNTGLSENCERLSVALMNNVCELTEFLS